MTPPPPQSEVKAPEGLEAMLGEVTTAVKLVQAIPWGWIGTRIKTFRSPKMTIVGPEASGKTTLFDVLYNQGTLFEERDHRRTQGIVGKHWLWDNPALLITFEGTLGDRPLILRNVKDTPGQREPIIQAVIEHIISSEPNVLVFVVDMSRPFNDKKGKAEIDTGKWFGELIAKAKDQSEGKNFRSALKKVGSIVVLLNKADAAYEGYHDAHVYDVKGKVENAYRDHREKFGNLIRTQIVDLFGYAGRSMDADGLKLIDCCLAHYEDKKFFQFDKGHLKMLEAVQIDSTTGKLS